MSNIKVIDSIMGTGKTSWAIQNMQGASTDKKFMYITPTLAEDARIMGAVTNRNFKEPEVRHGHGTKLNSLKTLIRNGEDIATTHCLLGLADEELITLLGQNDYTLIVDEVLDVLTPLKAITKDDVALLIDSGAIEMNNDGRVLWKKDKTFNSKYDEIRDYALAGNLYTNGDKTFIWNFPPKVFDMFHESYILSYLFDGQKLKYFFDLHNISYQSFSVIKDGNHYNLIDKTENEDRNIFKELINVYSGRYNNIGDKPYSLSKSWYHERATKRMIEILKNYLRSYLRYDKKARAEEILWTTFKPFRHKIKGKGFSLDSCFAAFNTRSTNQYKYKTVLAYCTNNFMHPDEKRYFGDNGIEVNEELFALSIMLQWIFRSAVREGNPINIYIPSKRMRELLNKWLKNEI